MSAAFLEVSHVYKRDGVSWILKDIHFSQMPFQQLAVAGETGSGKSTLLKIIAGIFPPDEGQVHFMGSRVKKVPLEKLIPGHPGIAYLSQHFELRNNYRVEEVLSYANTLSEADANTIYQICRIEPFLKRKTDQLSGGERQRIALARLLVSAPKLLLLDEPYSNLDPMHKALLKTVIQDIARHLKMSCILVSHDPLDTLSWADQILVMKAGEIMQWGSPQEIYGHPRNEYVAGLFGKYNLLDPAMQAAFPKVVAVNPDRKQLFLRPEQLKIQEAGQPGVEGRIQQISFMGARYEIEIQAGDKIFTASTDTAGYSIGASVSVSFQAGNDWYV